MNKHMARKESICPFCGVRTCLTGNALLPRLISEAILSLYCDLALSVSSQNGSWQAVHHGS